MKTKKPGDLRTTYSQSPGDHTSHTPAQNLRCHVGEVKVVTKMALSQTINFRQGFHGLRS